MKVSLHAAVANRETHDFGLAYEEALERLEFRGFPDDALRRIELPGKLSWVPSRDECQWQVWR